MRVRLVVYLLLCFVILTFFFFFFFFNDTAPTEIYTLSLHDALPISSRPFSLRNQKDWYSWLSVLLYMPRAGMFSGDRKSTRLNSSHVRISYAVFCLKKKKKKKKNMKSEKSIHVR